MYCILSFEQFTAFSSEYQQDFISLIFNFLSLLLCLHFLEQFFSKLILITEEVITAALNSILTTTKVILTTNEVITASLKVIWITTNVILATNKLVSTTEKSI